MQSTLWTVAYCIDQSIEQRHNSLSMTSSADKTASRVNNRQAADRSCSGRTYTDAIKIVEKVFQRVTL